MNANNQSIGFSQQPKPPQQAQQQQSHFAPLNRANSTILPTATGLASSISARNPQAKQTTHMNVLQQQGGGGGLSKPGFNQNFSLNFSQQQISQNQPNQQNQMNSQTLQHQPMRPAQTGIQASAPMLPQNGASFSRVGSMSTARPLQPMSTGLPNGAGASLNKVSEKCKNGQSQKKSKKKSQT